MNRPQLQKIEIQGFRSFGTIQQSFELPPTVTVLWGANSQGVDTDRKLTLKG
ncbi:hypothetical protein C8R34_13520 [Nitrosomonas sp. Nm84]|nr:hypothetical protein C8R34_13520 [Nitrosomonas sp. Nm84]